ncbi:MAG: GNAT family N-acetyltransferase [Planctomycetota bacterium]
MKIREMDIEFYRNFYKEDERKARPKKGKKEKVSIRHLKRSEVDVVKDLIHRTIDVCYSGLYDAESIKFFKDHHCEHSILQDAERGHTIVLVKKARVIGTGTILNDVITRVFVESGEQRSGFGKMIMQRLEQYAVNDDIRLVKLNASLPSKKFYDRLGYELVDKDYLEVDNHKKLHYYAMKKVLKQSIKAAFKYATVDFIVDKIRRPSRNRLEGSRRC